MQEQLFVLQVSPHQHKLTMFVEILLWTLFKLQIQDS